ncbi:MAG TPA: septum formation initiator family protein [Dehalococcoidia bacterium]|nr:septum formation initiator family protein [Dehalococcoidia bacterium]
MSRLPHLSLPTLLICAAVLAIGYFGFSTGRYVIHNYQLKQQESQVRDDVRQLDQDHAELIAARDYLQSDQYVEQVARRTLGLVHPGETLVVVSPADDVPAASPTAAEATPGAQWWKQLYFDAVPTPTPNRP